MMKQLRAGFSQTRLNAHLRWSLKVPLFSTGPPPISWAGSPSPTPHPAVIPIDRVIGAAAAAALSGTLLWELSRRSVV